MAPASIDAVFAHVHDLVAYDAWMPLIHHVEPLDDAAAPTWSVELRAAVGPLSRSKRLRMERTVFDPPNRVVFERNEDDGREHSPWTLEATLTADDDAATTTLAMRLSYGGSLWAGAVLERVLDDQVRQGSDQLLALLQAE